MKLTDLRQKESGALQKELHELLREQFNLRMQKGLQQTVKPHQFQQIRRNIARIKTVLREKASA